MVSQAERSGTEEVITEEIIKEEIITEEADLTPLPTVRISVRNLVEFILRSGDIDNRRGTMADKDAMQMGSRVHRKIQGKMGSAYQAEVSLSENFDCGDFVIKVEGRADGIIQEDRYPVIDEIKGIFRSLDSLEEPIMVHLAQAKCYAYIYSLQKGLSQIGVQMTYCNLETEEIRRFRETCVFEELEQWFLNILEEYKKWARWQMEWKKLRQDSIHQIKFPFAYREGQKDLAAAVYRTIARKKQLFIQAPTGAGKTISAIFPAVKAVGEGLGDKIFYLTAKTIARTVAEEAFSILKQQGLLYKVVTITAKEKICRCEEPECNPEACPYAKGHYDRVNDAVFEMISTARDFDRQALEEQAEKWQVCPFELSLDVSLWVDAVICDYNYVFDPRAHLKRFFAEGVKGDYLFLIDEAHNLVERGRDMFSAELYKEDFLALKKEVKEQGKRLVRGLDQCNKYLLSLKRECADYEVLENVGMFPVFLMNLCGAMEKFLEDSRNQELNQKVMDLYYPVRSFLDTCDRLDEHYVVYSELEPDGRFKLKLYCVDPSALIQECLDKGNSTIFFSATLLPLDYYKSLLSTKKDDYAVYASSSFDEHNKRVLIGMDTSSRYTDRNRKQYEKMAEYIRKAVSTKKGNYLIFFSSYKMMADVAECFENILPDQTELVLQKSGMNEVQREEFLEQFSEGRDKSLIGFCVMGSIFGEGIDLKKDRLIGAVIIGTGLPQVCNEREILKNYYSSQNRDGFRYAYLCPGMNKVLQAAGRVIRTEEDQGMILLLDERFGKYQYRSMFPREWADYDTCTLYNIEEKLQKFWGNVQEK
ncbi:MAG: ATP-dependent DNA helicase [Lachnospiraceae bacterium]|nr:ATP-dependent DNA helicase [Lachnospiraceae bacterium]